MENVSLSVGCGCIVKAISSIDAPISIAKVASDIISPALCPTIPTPNIFELSLEDKIKKVATEIYGAKELEISTTAKKQLEDLKGTNYEKFPVCIAKTQYSFTADPENGGLPQDHNLPVKEIRVSAGAEFVVVICGDIMLMPGLPRVPAAESIFIDDKGLIQGLF